MKKISSFSESRLENFNLKKIFGGRINPETPSERTSIIQGEGGCCQQEIYTDSFIDCNENGIWDDNETGGSNTQYYEVDCP